MSQLRNRVSSASGLSSYKGKRYVISTAARQAVADYHYTGEDHSAIAKYLYVWWRWVHGLTIPEWMSPNMVTMIGFAAIIVNFSLASFFFPRLIADPSSPDAAVDDATPRVLLCIVFSILLFFYQTMDAVDGLQGRVVNMYHNCTTEIFDHCTDSTVMSLMNIPAAAAFSFGVRPQALALMVGTAISFTCATWQHVHTGEMVFQAGIFNPTESVFITSIFFMVAAFVPASAWNYDLGQNLPNAMQKVRALLPFPLAPNTLLAGVILTGAIRYLIQTIVHVINHKPRATSTHKPTTRSHQALSLLPIFVVMFTAGSVARAFSIAPHTSVIGAWPICSMMTIAFSWNMYIMHLIACEITKVPFLHWVVARHQVPQLAVLAITAFSASADSTEPAGGILYFIPLFCVLASLYGFVTSVHRLVREVCDVLGMEHWYSIPPQKATSPAGSKSPAKSSSSN